MMNWLQVQQKRSRGKKKKKKSVEFGLKFGSSLLSYITQPKSVTSGNAPATQVGTCSRTALLPNAFAFTTWIYVHLEIRLQRIAYSCFLTFPRLDSKSDFLITESHSSIYVWVVQYNAVGSMGEMWRKFTQCVVSLLLHTNNSSLYKNTLFFNTA